MSKTKYHQLVKEWEKRRNHLLYVVFGLFVIGFMVAALFANFVPILADNPLFFGVTAALLALPPFYLAGKCDGLSKEMGLECHNCHRAFSSYRSLMEVGFTNKCPKCGAPIYET